MRELWSFLSRYFVAVTFITIGCMNIVAQTEDSLPSPIEGIELSATLPVCYINTEYNAPIVSKEDYINAEMWIDPMGKEAIAALGSKESPVGLQIRGRGNSSWHGFGKKPYRLKLNNKAELFGFPKSKHFALLAHAPTQMYFSESVAFELARLIGLGWVPRSYPVEVVLNGINVGVYAFSETVRIDEGRIDIEEQPEENEDETTIPYGWLVEIDNADDVPQIKVPQTIDGDSNAFVSRFTIKTPEVLSVAQEQWITDQLTTLTAQILNPDKKNATWTNLIDIESLAKYYIIQELSCNFDAFVGSTYFYKGSGDKWILGPMWDSGWTFVPDFRKEYLWNERMTSTGVSQVNYTWIKELIRFPEFRQEIRRVWMQFYPDNFNNIYAFMDEFYNLTQAGYETNGQIWPDYNGLTIHYTYNRLSSLIGDYAKWFNEMVVADNFVGIEEVKSGIDNHASKQWFTLQGVPLSEQPTLPGIYIVTQGSHAQKVVIYSR